MLQEISGLIFLYGLPSENIGKKKSPNRNLLNRALTTGGANQKAAQNLGGWKLEAKKIYSMVYAQNSFVSIAEMAAPSAEIF